VSHVEPGSAGHLKVWLQGGSDFEPDPDHHVSEGERILRGRGILMARSRWSKQSSPRVPEGANTFHRERG
jgi:hypothetical protein